MTMENMGGGEVRGVVPWWMGWMLTNPVRRLVLRPEEILEPHLAEGMTVIDLGCGPGFFAVPAAQMVGPAGRVVAVDVQQSMLVRLARRAWKGGVLDRVERRLCESDFLDIEHLAGRVDVAIAVNVLHEVSDRFSFLMQVSNVLVPEGRLLFMEPGFVDEEDVEETLAIAADCGLCVVERSLPRAHRGAVLRRLRAA